MRVLGLPYHAIRACTGVTTPTASDIYLRAVQMATLLAAEWQKEIPLQCLELQGICASGQEASAVGGVGGNILGLLDEGNREPGASEVGGIGADILGLLGQGNEDPGASEVGGGEGRIPGHLAREDSEPSALGVERTGGGILGGMGGRNIEPGAQEVGESMTGGIPGLLDREDSEREALGVESLEIGVSEVQVSGVEDVREITLVSQGGLDNIIGVSAGKANCWGFEMLGIGSNEELIRKDTRFSLLDLISAKSIDSNQRSGRPQA